MKPNVHSYSVTVDVMVAITAHVLGEMQCLAHHAPDSERALYGVVERAAWERLPPYVQRLIKERNVFERARKILYESGFEAWELCRERKHLK